MTVPSPPHFVVVKELILSPPSLDTLQRRPHLFILRAEQSGKFLVEERRVVVAQ